MIDPKSKGLLHHGGRLQIAIKQFGGSQQDWLDLSTGVSPWHYPIPELSQSCWNRLPEEDDGLIPAADSYYGGQNALAVAGSQAAIQCLPKVLACRRGGAGLVLLPKVGYKEHERAWRTQGWHIEYYGVAYTVDSSIDAYYPKAEQLSRCDALVVINPNNPAAHLIPASLLHTWLQQLSLRGASLVIDEAFMDMTPQQSILPCHDANLIVLRSIGKFFGLAGLRAGFVFAADEIRTALQVELGPWRLNGPARAICKQALVDTGWQQLQTRRLDIASQRLHQLLQVLPGKSVGTGLFQTIYLAEAPHWHKRLCQHYVFTRLTDEQDALRFGLPADESQWQKLTEVLSAVTEQANLSATEQINSNCEPILVVNSTSMANVGRQS
ncbi:threonine-phosphate decarboxylase CobD [Shewanella halifaxensis]|uniref:threonine-phosphate decarboxylase CobD n=1 Tax=Shewanella halifaxensis TaxID=271098 RepID=UPI000D5977AB|nr:threonine-phosphate decarboxylase CobD [Shewanella halifaxensis]